MTSHSWPPSQGTLRHPAAEELEHDVQRRMFWFGCAFIAAVGPLYVLLALLYVNRPSLWGALAFIYASLAAVALWARRSGNYARALTLLHGTSFIGVMFPALGDINVGTPAFWWMTVIPFVALLSGLTLLGIIQGTIVVGYAVTAFLLQGSSPSSDPDSLRLHMAVVLSTVYACAYLALATLWRQRLQSALDAARVAATAAGDAKARFLANMSHEIRTPLNGVIGAAELLRSGSASDAQRAQLVALQEQSAKTLLALVNDVLDWCKLDAGKVELEAEPLYLRGLVFEANELFAVAAFDKGIELTSSCNPDVPRRFVGDGTRIRQVVNNLVSNAVKFTEQGGVHIHLALEGEDPSDPPPSDGRRWVRIEVSDSGIGIAAEQLSRLFSAFTQADNSVTRKYGGTGLGLSICSELARLMEGRLEVSSTVGRGSTFALVVPLLPHEFSEEPQTRSRQRGVLLACANAGLIRHVRSLLHELMIEPEVLRHLPDDKHLQQPTVLLVDAPLLSSVPDARTWIESQARRGMKVAVMTPLNADAMVGTFAAGVVLYKPIRRAALTALLDAVPKPPGGILRAAPSIDRGSRGRHVLLCEDSPVNQIVVQAMLAELGATCVVAANGVEALAHLGAERFDMVFMDMQMPELDGLEATRRWRAIEARRGGVRVPIVAMTANAEGEQGAACRAAGMDGFVSKPFNMNTLAKALAVGSDRTAVRPESLESGL